MEIPWYRVSYKVIMEAGSGVASVSLEVRLHLLDNFVACRLSYIE
jgi:hypothetical protein